MWCSNSDCYSASYKNEIWMRGFGSLKLYKYVFCTKTVARNLNFQYENVEKWMQHQSLDVHTE